MSGIVLLTGLLACNGGGYVVRFADQRVSTEALKTQLTAQLPEGATLNKDELKAFAASLLATNVLSAEAARLGLKPVAKNAIPWEQQPPEQQRSMLAAALKDRLADELRSATSKDDISDADLMVLYNKGTMYPYHPERVMVSAAIFKKPSDADAFVRLARGLPVEPLKTKFRALFQMELARISKQIPVDAQGLLGAETWDFTITKEADSQLPQAIVEPAFAAKIGDVVGPISVPAGGKYKEPRSYVLHVEHKLPESNSFPQVREKLRTTAMHDRLLDGAEKAAHQLVMKAVQFDEAELAIVERWLAARELHP